KIQRSQFHAGTRANEGRSGRLSPRPDPTGGHSGTKPGRQRATSLGRSPFFAESSAATERTIRPRTPTSTLTLWSRSDLDILDPSWSTELPESSSPSNRLPSRLGNSADEARFRAVARQGRRR